MVTHFNSNMLIGLAMVIFAIAMYVSIIFNRYKETGFKGKLPVTIASIVIGVLGLILFIMGVVYEWPNLVSDHACILTNIAQSKNWLL